MLDERGREGRDVPCTVVIVHYGDTQATIDQVGRVSRWATQVVVVSNDGVKDQWFRSDPAVSWIVAPRNLGYGGAVNFVATSITTPVVAVLNTDLIVPDSAAREACWVISAGLAAIVGFTMRQPSGAFLSGAGALSRTLRLASTREPSHHLAYCEWATGAAMFMSSDCLTSVRFDERYFLGMEDVDFCVRAARKGMRTCVLTVDGVVHEGGAVIGAARWYYYSTRNPIWFLRTERGEPWHLLLVLRECFLLSRVLVADIVRRRGSTRSRLMMRGIWHGLTLDPAPGSGPYSWEPIEVELGSAQHE